MYLRRECLSSRELRRQCAEGAWAIITPATPNVNVGEAKVSVAVVNDREELRRFLESADGQRIIRDTMGRHRHYFGTFDNAVGLGVRC